MDVGATGLFDLFRIFILIKRNRKIVSKVHDKLANQSVYLCAALHMVINYGTRQDQRNNAEVH